MTTLTNNTLALDIKLATPRHRTIVLEALQERGEFIHDYITDEDSGNYPSSLTRTERVQFVLELAAINDILEQFQED